MNSPQQSLEAKARAETDIKEAPNTTLRILFFIVVSENLKGKWMKEDHYESIRWSPDWPSRVFVNTVLVRGR